MSVRNLVAGKSVEDALRDDGFVEVVLVEGEAEGEVFAGVALFRGGDALEEDELDLVSVEEDVFADVAQRLEVLGGGEFEGGVTDGVDVLEVEVDVEVGDLGDLDAFDFGCVSGDVFSVGRHVEGLGAVVGGEALEVEREVVVDVDHGVDLEAGLGLSVSVGRAGQLVGDLSLGVFVAARVHLEDVLLDPVEVGVALADHDQVRVVRVVEVLSHQCERGLGLGVGVVFEGSGLPRHLDDAVDGRRLVFLGWAHQEDVVAR